MSLSSYAEFASSDSDTEDHYRTWIELSQHKQKNKQKVPGKKLLEQFGIKYENLIVDNEKDKLVNNLYGDNQDQVQFELLNLPNAKFHFIYLEHEYMWDPITTVWTQTIKGASLVSHPEFPEIYVWTNQQIISSDCTTYWEYHNPIWIRSQDECEEVKLPLREYAKKYCIVQDHKLVVPKKTA